MKFYSEEIYLALRTIKKPYPFTVHVLEDNIKLILRVYENDIMRFSDSQRKVIMEYLLDLRQLALDRKVPCDIQGVAGDPL